MTNLDAPDQRQHALGRLLFAESATAALGRQVLVIIVVLLGLAQLRAPVGLLLPEYVQRKDVLQEYVMARAIREGVDPYLPTDVLAERYVEGPSGTRLEHPTPHPPTVAMLFLPLSLLGFEAAAALWLLLELVCLVAAVALLARATGARLSVAATVGVAAALLNWYPLWVEMALGQLTVPLLAIVAAAWLALRRSRWLLSGALVGFGLLVKPVLAPLLLLFVIRGRRRALASALLVVGGGYLAAGWVLGFATLGRYFTVVLPQVSHLYRASWRNISAPAVAWKALDGTSHGLDGLTSLPALLYAPRLAAGAAAVLPLVLALLGLWSVVATHSVDAALAVLVGVSVLVGPVSWPHYLVLLLVPAAVLTRWLVVNGFPARATNWALGIGILLSADWARVALTAIAAVLQRDEVAQVPLPLVALPWLATVAASALTCVVVTVTVDRES